MSYRDVNSVADWPCIRCEKPLDRVGAHCKACFAELFEEMEHAEVEHALQQKPVYPWKLLNDEFQKIFGPRK